MIKGIIELNFPSYATLKDATITMNAMGDNTITAQVYIDGDIVPSFLGTDGEPWAVEFGGTKYTLSIREPQASKSNETYSSVIELTFYNWAIHQLKCFYFAEMTSIDTGTAIADKYVASLRLTLPNFIIALNKVLDYYFDGKIIAECNSNPTVLYSTELADVEIDYAYIWDVLQNLNDIYDVRWDIIYDKTLDIYKIRFGYDAEELTHVFEYGFRGGLLKFERQVQSDDIKNIILGRGGDKNLPKLYFKDYAKYPPVSDALSNEGYSPDPDAIPELVNIYFDGLRDSNFRSYIRGWKAQKGYDSATYVANQGWAYEKGYTDKKFNPVEYVKDDESIAKYGERWGALDANENIYPTIQGVAKDPYGRIDEVIAVSKVITDDLDKLADAAITTTAAPTVGRSETISAHKTLTCELRSDTFVTPEDEVGNLTYNFYISASSDACVIDTNHSKIQVFNATTGAEENVAAIPAGTHYYLATIRVVNDNDKASTCSFGVQGVKITSSNPDREEWKPTFDIWIKNIWGTSHADGEDDIDYANRVWRPILGDSDGNSAAVAFSDGFLAVSDYEFTIVEYAYDNSKTYNGVTSEWKLTLAKTDAEYEATGLYIPNATTGGNAVAGDHFFLVGCDFPIEYVYWAEEKLTAYKETKGLAESADIQPTWSITLDKVRINTPDEALYGEKLIDKLSVGAIANIRDRRFTNNATLQLYINTLTYKWSEGDIVPSVEITLSDKVLATKSSAEQLRSEVSAIKREYVTADTVAKAVESVAGKMFLRKSGVSDTSYSPTTFAAQINSASFESGDVGGKGWGVYKDAGQMETLEIDKLIVRKEMHVNELVVNQVSYVGGKQIISAACIECTQVDDTDDGYVCHFDQKRGSVANLFKVDDVALSQVFSTDNNETKYYKRRVVAIDVDSITLSKTDAQGSGIPSKGDVIVQYGNYTDAIRQYVITRDVIGGGYEKMIAGLSSVTTDGEEYFFAGRTNGETPRFFVGDHNADYITYKDGKIYIRADIELEAGTDLYNQINETTEQVKAQHNIFYDTPTAPYKSGDLWVNAGYPSGEYVDESGNAITLENGDVPYESLLYEDDVLICIESNSDTFDLSDWRYASRYHEDKENIQEVNENLSNYKKATTATLAEFSKQIDGVVDSWFFGYVPTADNYPANTWTTTTLKQQHVGDTFTNNEAYVDEATTPYAGLSWRWVGVGDFDAETQSYSSYQWTKIADSDAVKALKDAAAAQTTADGKRRVFVAQPTTPYDEGDLWVNATYGSMYSNDFLRVKDGINRTASESFSIGDWGPASGYTNDAAFNNFLQTTYQDFVDDITGQVDEKAETYYQSSDPSSSWMTSAVKASHVGDLWYNTVADDNGYYHTYIYRLSGGSYGWVEMNGVPKDVFDSFDGRATIFVSKPTTYHTNDMWIIGSEVSSSDIPSDCTVGDIVISLNDRTSRYVKADWVKKDKYTDDSVFNDFLSNDYATFVDDITSQVDNKAETFYQVSDPSSSWTTAAQKASHVGDLWCNTTADAHGNHHTYIYKLSGSTYGWEEINGVPESVFDTIDGKATIFVSKPTTYSENDIWIIESSVSESDLPSGCKAGDIVVSSASRAGSYTKSDWSKKDRYTDDTKIEGILDNLDSDTVLSQFEKLSLRTKLKEINSSESATVDENDGQGSLSDWVQACKAAGVSYSAAVVAANNLFDYMANTCHVWENTDTIFETTDYLTTISTLIANYNAAVSGVVQGVPDMQYLKMALGSDTGTTLSSGGITLGTFIGVKDSSQNVVAAINSTTAIGNDDTNGRLMIFAGANGASLADNANFRVYENGYLYANNAEIRGKVYAESGEFRGNIIIGNASGRRVEIQSGNYGTLNMFDAEGNATTHVGNDYCSSIGSFLTSSSTNTPYIPTANGLSTDSTKGWTATFSNHGKEIPIDTDSLYTSRKFSVTGDTSTNKVTGSIPYSVSISGFSANISEANIYLNLVLEACTDTNGSNPVSLVNQTIFASGVSSTSGKLSLRATLPAGTYYIFSRVYGIVSGGTVSTDVSVTISLSAVACSVVAISQKLEIFANGLGYKYSTAQYFALLREASSFSATGDLAMKVRTGTTSSPVGFDVVTSGLKMYGKVRTKLGTITGANKTATLSASPDNFAFVEIQALFDSNKKRVAMLMSVEEWKDSSSSSSFLVSTDVDYVRVYRNGATSIGTGTADNLSSVVIFGIL